MRILWSAVIKSPKSSALGTTVPARLLQEALVIFSKQISQFWVLRRVRVDNMLTQTQFTFARDSIGNSWEELEVSWYPSSRFPHGSEGLLSSTKFSLKSCSQSGKSCNRSLCTSSRPSFLFLFSVSVGLCSGFLRNSSLVLSGTGFSVYLLSSNTESRDEDDDEDDDEVGVGVVEELVDKPGTTNGT